jgi:hypothetical protein
LADGIILVHTGDEGFIEGTKLIFKYRSAGGHCHDDTNLIFKYRSAGGHCHDDTNLLWAEADLLKALTQTACKKHCSTAQCIPSLSRTEAGFTIVISRKYEVTPRFKNIGMDTLRGKLDKT